MTSKPRFAMQENIAHNLLFVDGITRCGKSIFTGIVGTLQNCEHLRFKTLIEHVVPALYFGAIDKEFAKSSMRALYNETTYETLISRNANFRPGDQSSVLEFYDPKLYIDRLCRQEGDDVVDELRQKARLFPFQTHDIMVNLEHLDSLEFDYKMIELYRHPVDVFYSWYTRGWGERFGEDPRAFTLCIERGGKTLPWYCAGYEEEWLGLNPMERCVRTAIDLLEKSVEQQKRAKHPDRILTITFEDMVERTDSQMVRIYDFLEREATAWTDHFLKKANCPRVLYPEDRKKKLAAFKDGISPTLYEQLLDNSAKYEANVYGLV
jgi:hypothetical protein